MHGKPVVISHTTDHWDTGSEGVGQSQIEINKCNYWRYVTDRKQSSFTLHKGTRGAKLIRRVNIEPTVNDIKRGDLAKK